MGKLKHWLEDSLYMARGYSRTYLHREPPSHYLGHIVEGKVPVILIQGIAQKWGFLKNVGDEVSLKGHPVYIVPELGYNFNDIPTSAQIIRTLIDQNNLHDVLLIGHSKGGLIGKYLLVHKNEDNRIKGLIAIATPFSGSNSGFIFPFKSYRELTPQSGIIKDLNSQTDVNKKIISMYPKFDNFIWSKAGSFLPGATNVEIDDYGHNKILFNKKLISQIESLISS